MSESNVQSQTPSALIYVVDDEPMLLDILSQYLTKAGKTWKVECFSRPTLAIEAARQRCPDIVVSDFTMPEMNGSAMLEQIRHCAPHSIRILVSGYADPKAMGNKLSSAHQYIAKPFALPDIRAKITKALVSLDHFKNDEIRGTVLSLKTLPAMPQIYYELLAVLDNPDCSYSQVVDIIAKDSAISARMLQMANSPFFSDRSAGGQTIDLFQAVTILGTERIKAAVLSQQQFSHYTAIPDYFIPANLSQHRWETANLSIETARKMRMPEEQARDAFVVGLMHDMGRLILMDNFNVMYYEACKKALEMNRPLTELEEESFKMGQADVVGFLVSLWGMRDTVSDALIYQEKPWMAPTPESVKIATAVYVAHHKAHTLHTSEKFKHPDLNADFVKENNLEALLEVKK